MLSTLAYHPHFVSKTEILVLRNTFIDSNEWVFWVNSQYAKCQTSILCTTDREGLRFSDVLDQCSLKVVTAKFDMSNDLVRGILKAKMYIFLVVNCVSEMQ